ncbi:helix-turn-helix transcriptional regulator [Eubacteriaceae bacterium ES2]|nr:helix-turn-helix transcriptional regulator [Eubacteriaceae bacterium ES2]
MNTLNIGKNILDNRRKKGITQEALANFLGVSKASVSKWETLQSYPDILLLPELSSYFNISIDALIGYSPQMTGAEIKKTYRQFADDFSGKPFDSVYASCQNLIKEYYACLPFLSEMALLYINHHMLADTKEKQKSLLKEAITLCQRVKSETAEVKLLKEAINLEATACLMLGDAHAVLNLLGETASILQPDTEMISQAYELLGNIPKAKEILQISMYQHLIMLVASAPSYLMMHNDEPEKFEQILSRALAVSEIYDLENLHPNTMVQIYYAAANHYCVHNNKDTTYEMLAAYTNVCCSKFFPYSLHGDEYFNQIDTLFEELDVCTNAPRSKTVIIDSMIDGVMKNPIFEPLKNEKRFKQILQQLKSLKGETK